MLLFLIDLPLFWQNSSSPVVLLCCVCGNVLNNIFLSSIVTFTWLLFPARVSSFYNLHHQVYEQNLIFNLCLFIYFLTRAASLARMSSHSKEIDLSDFEITSFTFSYKWCQIGLLGCVDSSLRARSMGFRMQHNINW